MTSSAENTKVGSEQCQSCHANVYQKWQQSHHFKAMQTASRQSVLGDFNNAVFSYNGLQHRFRQNNGEFFVRTDNADGVMQEFKIAYTFGFEPLQQYLIAMPDGRFQVLSICWDARPKAQGGQRWFHLYPEEAGSPAPITHEHPLHWTGAFQNWNSRCASCHSTDLKKNYDVDNNRFDTTFSEVNVACEACHGAASEHLAWAKKVGVKEQNNHIITLDDGGDWRFSANDPIARRTDNHQSGHQVENCASCHALRTPLEDQGNASHDVSKRFDDQYSLRLLEDHYYHVDGQIDDEVFVYGSFLQSKMHQAGVVCSDCHEPHSGEVLAGEKNVCMQCHQHEQYNQPSHHQHPTGQSGSFCVDCHMPAKTYMGVDARRDHSFSIPRPELSQTLGTPNACNACHRDQTIKWAVDAIEKWPNSGDKNRLDVDYSRAIFNSRQGQHNALQPLLGVIDNPQQSAIKRASALLELSRYPVKLAFEASVAMLQHDEPIIRAAALRSLSYVPAEQRRNFSAISQDQSKTVRMAAAEFLSPLSVLPMPPRQQAMLTPLFNEYKQLQQANADVSSAQTALGNFFLSAGDTVQAEQAFQQALKINPYSEVALLSLAELARQKGLSSKEKNLLDQALKYDKHSAAGHHAMGLFYVRQKLLNKSLRYLSEATVLASENMRYHYVYAVALHSSGRGEQALDVVQNALIRRPNDQPLLQLRSQLSGQAR